MPINSTKWELLESSPDDGGLTIFNDCDAICEHIADPAIGRVFLAAPDMLAALKDAQEEIRAWRRWAKPGEGPDKPAVTSFVLDKIASAIAKAEGTA